MTTRDTPMVLTARDACATFGEGHTRWMIERGRWQRPARGVVVRHSGPLTRDDTLWCELLLQAPGAALAGLSAASLDGLRGFATPAVFVLAPRGVRIRPRDGVVVRSSLHLGNADIHPVRLPRRTRLPRSVVDAASWAGTELKTQAIIAASVQQGLVSPRSLDSVVQVLVKVHRRRLIVETIRDVAGGSLSEYELLFLKMCRRFNLPTPARQRRRKDAAGRWRYLDVDFDDYQLVAEIDGQQHMEALAWWEDMERNNDVVVEDGKTLLRFAGFALRRQPSHVAGVLRKFFDGHPPTPRQL